MTLALILLWHFWTVDTKLRSILFVKWYDEAVMHLALFTVQTGPILLILWLAGVDLNG